MVNSSCGVNHYAVLGVKNFENDQEKLQKAYRKLAL